MENQEYNFCTKCGAKMPIQSKFCTACGAPFDSAGNVIKTEQYKDPARANNQAPGNSVQQIISKNTGYYIPQFEQIKTGNKSKINWASFFLGLVHAAYRNVWKEWFKDTGKFFAAEYIAIIIGSIGCFICFMTGNIAAGGILFVVSLVVAFILGLIYVIKGILFSVKFNKVYFKHVEKKAGAGDYSGDPSVGRALIISVIFSIITGIVAFSATSAFSLAMLSGIEMASEYEDDEIYDDYDDINNYSSEYDNNVSETVESSYDNQNNELKNGTYIYDDGSSVYNTAIVSEDETGQRIDIESMGYGGHGQGVGGGYLNALGNGVYTCFDDSDFGTMTITLTDGGFSVVTHPAEGMETMYSNLDGEYTYNGSGTAVAINETEATSNVEEYIFPDSNTRYLTDSDVAGMDKATVRLGINEIYARHGRMFDSEDLNTYFTSKSWYTPLYSADEFALIEDSVMNEYEKENIKFLAAVRDGMADNASEFKADWIYGTYIMTTDAGAVKMEAGFYSDSGYDYIKLNGSYADSTGYFEGTVRESDGNSYIAVDDSDNVVNFVYNGIDSIEITNADNTGGMNFPGFEGTYKKTADF